MEVRFSTHFGKNLKTVKYSVKRRGTDKIVVHSDKGDTVVQTDKAASFTLRLNRKTGGYELRNCHFKTD